MKSFTTASLAVLVAITAPANAVSAPEISRPFTSAPMSDVFLAASTAGFSPFASNLEVMLDQAGAQDFRTRNGIGVEIMDNWWATEGATFVAAGFTIEG